MRTELSIQLQLRGPDFFYFPISSFSHEILSIEALRVLIIRKLKTESYIEADFYDKGGELLAQTISNEHTAYVIITSTRLSTY